MCTGSKITLRVTAGATAAWSRETLVRLAVLVAAGIPPQQDRRRRLASGWLLATSRLQPLAGVRMTLARMIEVGRRLRDQHGADMVMGCSGMASYCADFEEAVQIPVVEPT